MTPDAHQIHLQMIQFRFSDLDISTEQAELIAQHEQLKNFPLENQFFSTWEEWDFERTSFKEILSVEQFELYEQQLNQRILQFENDHRTDDKERVPNEIAYHHALYDFYAENFLPDFFNYPLQLLLGDLFVEKTKIDYLKSEYKKYLDANKKDMLISHFRHHRLLMPNQLKLILLRHKLSGCWPHYLLFKHRMDEPTRAVIIYLKSKISLSGKKVEEFLKQKESEKASFIKSNFEKYYNSNAPVVTWGQPAPEDEQEVQLMSLLLLDEKRYGC